MFPRGMKEKKGCGKVIAESRELIRIEETQGSRIKMVEYVKGSEVDKWHWCKNCTQYPSYIHQRRSVRPHSDLCNQCKVKEDNKDCTT